MNKIRAKDTVMVISGGSKGARGEVKQVLMDANGKPSRVIVEGVNMLSHFVRPNPQKNEPGGIIKKEQSIHVSNVAPIDAESDMPARVKITKDESGKKQRSFYVSPRRKA